MKIIKTIFLLFIILSLTACSSWIVITDSNDKSNAETSTQNNQYETLLNNDSEFLNCIRERFANENNYTCLFENKSNNNQKCLYNLFSDEYNGIINCYASARSILLNLKQTKYWNDISEFEINFFNTNDKLKFKMKVEKEKLDELILNLDDVADMSAVS